MKIQYDQKWNDCNDYLNKNLENMDLNYTDVEMINQISKWINKNLSYKLNDRPICETFDFNQVQCYHYASVFKDMCEKIGIKCDYIESSDKSHCWNRIYMLNKNNQIHEYYFDLTISDKDDKINLKYTWMKEYNYNNV